ncbi:diguanylate cyclase (GGDEF) domain-containing protein [Ruminococcaceae bacterium FB2012]|nr:diguanylate cyclase (GGDEF) domain-containing protein [Ruminococcaceae bacterium FB2012]
MNTGLIFTNENCIGCNKCVRICCSFGASVSYNRPDHSSIFINPERCIGCGACIDVCTHGARNYHDDTEQFFADLSKGEAISLLIAPAFEARYPKEYKKVLGALKALGVRRMLPVSLGADICTWAYLKLINEKGYTGRISTTCPVVVSFVEHWMPKLLQKLMPVKSPMMCAAQYFRQELGITDKFAFVGPCIAKRAEMDKYPELVQYNITFPKLIEYVNRYGLGNEERFEGLDAGLGTFYPAPGGLADNIKWFMGDDTPVRVISGKTYLYQRFRKNWKKLTTDNQPFVLYDALNCREGCLEGTARIEDDGREDRSFSAISDIRANSKCSSADSPWSPELSCAERLENLNRQFASLDINDYLTGFEDKSAVCRISYPTNEEAEAIFLSMHKETEHSREINCSACGYNTCRDMMIAIHNGFNTRHNCVYSEKEETLFLTKMSFSDTLTGVMNRNAYERKLKTMFARGGQVGLIIADVNGLKQANDNEGHAAGDRLIIETAHALANEFGVECVFRTGGDEFLVILQDFGKAEIESDISLVKEYLASVNVSVAMGLAFTEHFDGDIDTLREAADKKMYEDKESYYRMTGNNRRI